MNINDHPPKFFRTPAALRAWLEKNHDTKAELVVGLYKVHAADRGVTYAQAVDEALCFGWIDGVMNGVDADSFKIRFTPRKAKSIWSQVNLAKAERLIAEGRMAPPGLAAYAARDPERAKLYSFENHPRTLPPPWAKRFRANAKAWTFFESTPPSYRRTAIFWVVSAKKEATREKRLEELIARSAAGLRLRQLTPYPRRRP
jgi:uncharacterized protein YdeI (YjbR/CyaY-like superfamily)